MTEAQRRIGFLVIHKTHIHTHFPAVMDSAADNIARQRRFQLVLKIALERTRTECGIIGRVSDIGPGLPGKFQFDLAIGKTLSQRPQLDVLYMTRIQRERFVDPLEYERNKGIYVLTKRKLERARPDMLVMHPLPRVDEITVDVDDDPRAAYFEQVQNAVYIRMALIMTLLGLKDPKAEKEGN